MIDKQSNVAKSRGFTLYEQVEKEEWEKADSLIERLRLTHLKGKPYRLLSKGEKRRVIIARALMIEPKLLVLDEQCSGLDILSRERFLQSLDGIMKDKCHIVYLFTERRRSLQSRKGRSPVISGR